MFDVEVVPLLRDNYAYVLVDKGNGDAWVVDPSESEPVLAHLDERGYRLVEVWNTHHHFDHVGGNEALQQATNCSVVASTYDSDRVPAQSRRVSEGGELTGAGRKVQVLETPGHTLGAVSYLIDGNLFTGDTLFLAGCGRLFEGTPEQMWKSLCRLRALPGETLVWCGHEYTEANLRFALWLEPDNFRLTERAARERSARSKGAPTVPAPMSEERETNPFLRADDPALLEALKRNHGVTLRPGSDCFAWIRAQKDGF